jgi:transposase
MTMGLDTAKNVFQLHGVDGNGKTVLRKQLKGGKLLEFFAKLLPCLIGLEASSGAHYWARELIKMGHDSRLIRAVSTISDSVIVRM